MVLFDGRGAAIAAERAPEFLELWNLAQDTGRDFLRPGAFGHFIPAVARHDRSLRWRAILSLKHESKQERRHEHDRESRYGNLPVFNAAHAHPFSQAILFDDFEK
jgi:hypothetical protein